MLVCFRLRHFPFSYLSCTLPHRDAVSARNLGWQKVRFSLKMITFCINLSCQSITTNLTAKNKNVFISERQNVWSTLEGMISAWMDKCITKVQSSSSLSTFIITCYSQKDTLAKNVNKQLICFEWGKKIETQVQKSFCVLTIYNNAMKPWYSETNYLEFTNIHPIL